MFPTAPISRIFPHRAEVRPSPVETLPGRLVQVGRVEVDPVVGNVEVLKTNFQIIKNKNKFEFITLSVLRSYPCPALFLKQNVTAGYSMWSWLTIWVWVVIGGLRSLSKHSCIWKMIKTHHIFTNKISGFFCRIVNFVKKNTISF